MLPIAELIQELWTQQRVRFETDYEEEFEAVFSRPGGLFDIVLYQAGDAVGFITLKNEKPGRYSIVNDLKINPHLTFDNTPGHGIEVKRKHRKKGIGAALLSLGIGMVQQDFKLQQPSAPFKVVATDISRLGLGCYRTFGFDIREGIKVSEGEYSVIDTVPELDIRSWKMPLLFRVIRKLRG